LRWIELNPDIIFVVVFIAPLLTCGAILQSE